MANGDWYAGAWHSWRCRINEHLQCSGSMWDEGAGVEEQCACACHDTERGELEAQYHYHVAGERG